MIAVPVAAQAGPSPAALPTYQLWAQGGVTPCLYAVGDVFVGGDVMRQTLRDLRGHYRAVELLTGPETPEACVAEARKAARKAGFTQFEARTVTQRDKDALLPPHG
jgi:hypothetical protein